MATSTLGSGTLVLAGTTSGTTTVTATAVAGTTTLTLPAATDTLVGKATTDTLTNKTLTGAAMNGTVGATTPAAGAFTTLSATGVTTVQAGTAAAPAITTTGDTNTGIFFPAADTIAFSEGGAEAMRIDSAGNVGIGTSSAAQKLNIQASGNTYLLIEDTLANGYNAATLYKNTDRQFRVGTVGGVGGFTSGAFIIYDETAAAWRMVIDSSGNLLVGTTSQLSTEKFGVLSSGTNQMVYFRNSNATTPAGIIVNYSVATPNNTGSEFFFGNDPAQTRITLRSNGGIANYSGNNVNLSDRREKTNFAPAKSYLDVICAIPVQTFNYIDQNIEEDAGLTLGVIAQDVQAVAPELVSESDWSPEKDGSKMRLSIYQTDLQYALMKCIQEQQALITALTARITALETA